MSNPRKRAHGEGSITQLPSGKWRVRVSAQGKRISYTADSKAEVAAWARKTIRQVERGMTYESTQTRLGEFLDSWLETKSTRLRPASMEQYRRLARLYIKPRIGDLTFKNLNQARIQAFYDQLDKDGVGKRTIELVHTVLHGCLTQAQRLGLAFQNWASLAEVPRPAKREMAVWNEDQVNQFLATVDDPLYRMAFVTGMRRGELIGLKWIDLDWQAETITVRRQVQTPEGGGWRFQEPKTKRGRRVIRIGAVMLEALRVHFNETLPLMRRLAGDRWQEHDLIFPSTVGTPRGGYEVSKVFKRLAERAGLPPIRFHDVRHSAASIMLLHREPPIRVAAILGQSLAVLMDVYAHYCPDDQASAAALWDAITAPVAVDFEPSGHKLDTKR